VAVRIRETLAADQEHPPLSASIGASVYHGEGERVENLLKEADQNLYIEKAKRKELASRSSDVSRRRLKKT
jgi:GGDEF domain-containing protein